MAAVFCQVRSKDLELPVQREDSLPKVSKLLVSRNVQVLRKWPLTPVLQLLMCWEACFRQKWGHCWSQQASLIRNDEWRRNEPKTMREWTRTVIHSWQTFVVCMGGCGRLGGCWRFHFCALWLQLWFVFTQTQNLVFNALSYFPWGKNQFPWSRRKLPHHPHLHKHSSHPHISLVCLAVITLSNYKCFIGKQMKPSVFCSPAVSHVLYF